MLSIVRQLHPERGAFAGFALDSKTAAVGLDDSAAQVEAETYAGDSLANGVAAAAELFEDTAKVVGVDAWAIVRDLDPHTVISLTRLQRYRGVWRRVLAGIADQVP